MQGLSGIRIAHCFLPCSGRSPAAKQVLLLLGFQQTSTSLKCWRKAFSPVLKTSLQDGASTESAQTSSGEEVSRNLAEEEVKHDDAALEEGPKVKVKFILEKKCYFGQRFNVVGNDPLFGDWEVEAAIPMEWAEGDIWTVEVDVPAEKEFEFKFVLTGKNGDVVWQPGSNRLFKTIEGVSPLVVNEVWNSVDEPDAGEVGEEPRDPVNTTTTITSETDGMSLPAEIPETEGVKDEVVKALESKEDGADVHSTLESDSKAAPEVPLAELDIATTAVKSAIGADYTA